VKKILIVLGLLSLIVFVGCSSPTPMDYCENYDSEIIDFCYKQVENLSGQEYKHSAYVCRMDLCYNKLYDNNVKEKEE